MSIRIKRNAAGNCITFEGSSNPVYWNACLSGEIDSSDNTLINVINDIATGQTGTTQYEFFRIPYTEFVDADDNPFANAQAVVDYLALVGNVAQAEDVNSGYKGVWDVSTNTPNITGSSTIDNGDWYYVGVSGSIDLGSGSIDFLVNDIVKYVSSSGGTYWEKIANETIRVDQLDEEVDSITTNSALTQYDIHVDSSYIGDELGTVIKPFTTIQQAISASSASEVTEILLNGDFTITSSLIIPDNKKIHLHGTARSTIKYASYSQVNGNLITYAGTNYSGEFVAKNLEFENAGGFAISVVSASKIDIDDCTFENNGWSGTGLSLVAEETGSTLGYNSSTGSLQTFYAAQCSEGGAISIGNSGIVEITDNTIKNNNKGIEVIDSGFIGTTEAFGFMARNQIYNNVSIGIDLESSTGDSFAGNRNFTVYNNAINQNGDSGIKIEGGINNTLSLGVIKGNWNAGVELAHVANTRVRDLDLDNNNRAGVDAEGDESDGLSSLQIEGNTIKDGATFIAEIFNVQIHNTNLGSSAVKCGLLIKEDVGDVVGASAIIKLDNVGFIEQDYALDVACDLDNLRLIIGDCEYVDVRIQAVRFQSEVGRYSELPFSNFTVDTPYVDFTKDLVSQTISVLDGSGGKTINTYPINHITAIQRGTEYDIVLTNTDKIQLRGLTEDRTFINGVAQTGTINDAVNAVNAFFAGTENTQPDPITTPVINEDGVNVTVETGSRTIDPVGDDEFAGNSSGYNHGFVFADQAIDQGGEYYTFQIRREGIIGMGFHKSGSAGIYSFDNLGTGTGNGHYGMHWSTWFHPTPNGPWTYYGEASGQTSLKSGWYNFDDSSTGADWLADENVLMKAGLDDNGHLYLSYYNTTTEEYVEIAKKSTPSIEGDLFHLVVKFGDANVRLYDTPKVHLRAETDLGTGSIDDQTVYLFGTATGTLADGIQITDATGDKSGFVTSASISASGQYFEFTRTGAHSSYAGLSNEDDYSATFIQTEMNASASVDEERFFYAGGYIFKDRDSWQPHGLTDDDGSSSGFSFNNGSGYLQRQNNTFRVGIDTDGKITYWQKEGTNPFVVAAKSVNAVPVDSTLKFLWKGDNANAELTSLTIGTLDTTPDLTYYAIESPDGVWHYPIFQTAEEANYFDANLAQPSTGSGTSHTHVYVDDLSGTTWYMPNSGSAMNSSTHPTGSYLSGSNFNYVGTADDDLYAPSGFGNVTITLNEGDSLNQQVIPAGYTNTRTLVNPPSWISLSGYNVVGTAPQVLLNNTTVPSASYEVTVRSSNAYGSTDGTLTVKVLNTTSNVSLPGTIHQGTFLSEADYNNDYGTSYVTSPNRDALIVTTPAGENGAVYDLPYALDDGDSYEWPFTAFLNIGIVSESVDKTGSDIVDATDFNTRFNLLFSNKVNGSTLQFSRPSGNDLEAVGWDDNTLRNFPGGPHATTFNANNPKDMLKLYNNAGRIELSYDVNDGNGYQLFASSSVLHGTGSDAPTITAVTPDGFDVDNVTLPTFTHTEAAAVAITGWTHFTGSANLSSSAVLNPDSAVQLDLELRDGERIIFTKQWVEANVLPYMDQDEDSTDATAGAQSVFLGVLRDSADVTDGITQSDFEVAFEWFNSDSDRGNNNHRLRTINVGTQQANIGIGSTTNALYDFAFDNRGGVVEALAILPSNGNVATELSVANGGTWNQSITNSLFTAGETVRIVIGTQYGEAGISNTGVSRVDSPLTNNEFNVTEDTFSLPLLTGPSVTGAVTPASITLNAGQTYKFYMDDSSIEAADILDFVLTSDSSAYTTGVTSSGTPGTAGAYIEFAVPQDVPPISLRWRSGGVGSGTSYGLTIAGSTYVVPVTGITLEGPSVNQTGTNLFNDPAVDADGVVWGWLSIDEQLNAGQRFIMDNAFLVDLTNAMPNNTGVFIGLKSGTWTNNYRNNSIANATVGGARFAIYKYSSSDIRVFGYVTGGTTIGRNYGTNGISNSGVELAIDLTNSGNNIRLLMQSGINSSDDVNTTTYADWSSTYKTQTGDQGYGLSAIDVMFLGDGNVSSTAASGPMDSADVDWTGLSEISVPTAPTILTSWNKALDFSGNSERAQMISSNVSNQPIAQNVSSTNTWGVSGNTSSHSSGRPWATAIVFKIDGNSSNQHIWNQGEGAGSTDDNIYLRVDANRRLYFGWGRSGALNEIWISDMSSYYANDWVGVYIGYDGRRWSGAEATATNLANTFDIRLLRSGNSWNVPSNMSTWSNWNSSVSTTGGRMDRTITGDFTIGGRGSNRNFHGKVASFVSTTLRLNVAMPTDAEIEMMIKDPMQWIQDYKVGNYYRQPNTNANSTNFQIGNTSGIHYPAMSTQVWLMGDGPNDSYANMIRNQINMGDQNYTKLNMISMVSNDIETVNITGLT